MPSAIYSTREDAGRRGQSGGRITPIFDAAEMLKFLGGTGFATPSLTFQSNFMTPTNVSDGFTKPVRHSRWDQRDSFGVKPPNENPSGLGVFTYNLRFPGQLYDAETGETVSVRRHGV